MKNSNSKSKVTIKKNYIIFHPSISYVKDTTFKLLKKWKFYAHLFQASLTKQANYTLG